MGGTDTPVRLQSIVDDSIEALNISEEQQAEKYDSGVPKVRQALNVAVGHCAQTELLERVTTGYYQLTAEGVQVLTMADDDARDRISTLVSEARARTSDDEEQAAALATPPEPELERTVPKDEPWRLPLKRELFRLPSMGFELFVIEFLRTFGFDLDPTPQSRDGGIDGIGTVILTELLHCKVVVQSKRWDPEPSGRPAAIIRHGDIAVFQRRATRFGAERAVFVTLTDFTPEAESQALEAPPPVELINGDRLVDLMIEKQFAVFWDADAGRWKIDASALADFGLEDGPT